MKGLDSCHHKEPSIVDHQTVVRSRNLDPTFLYQCGIPQQVADCLLLLPHQPLQTSIVSQVVADNPPRRAELYHVFPISKTYEPKQGFLLDEKKLQRIHDILLTGLNRCRDQSCLIYEVFRADHSYLKTSRVEDVFKEGNKNLKRITRISVSNEHSNELKLELVFQKLSSGGHTVLKVEGDKAEATVPAYEALQQYLASQVNVVKDQSKIRLLLSIKMGLLFFLNLTALQPLSKQYPILAASVNTITNVTAILAILIALIGGLKWYLGPELVNDYLFPDSFFLFGQETNHYRKIQELRKTVILSFVIASALGILVNLYTS
ncbi:hypothetical protein [Leptolyngbya sp. FACHB-261]|uniref:hypothetical protein n=1 Tax=Leptolyngbya sp. FACHB-261 TaxID=2692806 RepID=UPI001F558FBC|nr:hypothetical protein [Leptolyngbya sp. FACHB-261]